MNVFLCHKTVWQSSGAQPNILCRFMSFWHYGYLNRDILHLYPDACQGVHGILSSFKVRCLEPNKNSSIIVCSIVAPCYHDAVCVSEYNKPACHGDQADRLRLLQSWVVMRFCNSITLLMTTDSSIDFSKLSKYQSCGSFIKRQMCSCKGDIQGSIKAKLELGKEKSKDFSASPVCGTVTNLALFLSPSVRFPWSSV